MQNVWNAVWFIQYGDSTNILGEDYLFLIVSVLCLSFFPIVLVHA